MGKKTKRTEESSGTDTVVTPRIINQIAKHLTEEGWKFIVDDTDIHLTSHGDNGTCEVMVSTEEEAQRFFVYAYCPVAVPATHQLEMTKYVVAANLPLACAKLMLSPKGRLYTETGAPLGSDGVLDGRVFSSLFHLAMGILDDRLPEVLQIVYAGATAADVLARREHVEAPKD